MDITEAIKLCLHHYNSGNLQEAERLCKIALREQPDNPEIMYFLGIIYAQLGNYELSIQYIRRSIQFNPDHADAYLSLGLVFRKKGQIDEAISYFKKTMILNPDSVEAYLNMGDIFKEKGLINDAISLYAKALQLNPDSAVIHAKLGKLYQVNGRLNEAIACFNKAIELDPEFIHAYYELAVDLMGKWQLNEAINICKKILQINTTDVLAYYILGNIFMTQGKLTEAETFFRRAMEINPDDLKSHQAFLMLMSYSPKYDAQSILSGHLQFAKRFEDPLHSMILPHNNDRTLDRKLRIGYVSPDFKKHPVAYFIEPVLMSHNGELFEIFCYSDVSNSDEITNRMQYYADQWRNIAGIPDEKVAEIIRNDRIDILVDLVGHTGGVNRILLFARKPAPIQVNWIGYPTTTGISKIDYKIVDNYTDPPEMTDRFYTEKLLRLPESFLCYLPDQDSPDVVKLPALTSGHITFGSFNNFVKVVPEVMMLWSRILKNVRNSQLIMKSPGFSDKAICSYIKSFFKDEGIETERIKLHQPLPSIKEHLDLYNQIDIGLDTFPYNGTTTTCEAMWMGVPVVTLAGDTPSSRVGISLLSNVGVRELISSTDNQYFEIAVNLAKNVEKLKTLRKRLRDMMIHSPLTDAKKFTINLEKLYRKMWETWCKSV